MSADIQRNIEDLGRAFEQFKAANDQQITEKAKGVIEPILDEKLRRIDAALNDLQKAVEVATVKGARPDADSAPRDEYKSAFLDYARKGGNTAALEAKAMSVGSDPNGGYLVPVDMSGRIVTKIFETSPIRQYANVVSTSSDLYEGLSDRDEVSAGWVGEVTSRTETDTPELGKYQIQIGEIYAEPRITQKMLDDAQNDIGAWLEAKIADYISRQEVAAFVTGNGINKPRGITTYTTAATADSSRTWGQIEHIASGSSGAFTSTAPQDKLIDMTEALKPAYRNGAVFMGPRAVISLIRKFKTTTEAAYIWQPSYTVGQPSTLLGYPVVNAEDFPTVAANSLSFAFGNFREAYTVVDRLGIRTLRDALTAKPYVKFYTTKRVGGAVVNFDAIKLLKFAAS